jgi:HEAT repeat protein
MPLFGPPNIAQLEAKRDTQGLIKALGFKDAAIRMAAADALAPLKDPMAVEPLVGLLGDEHPGVRRAAVAALSARGGFRVVEPLVSALEDRDPEVRATARTAVYRRLMTDPDQDARRAATAALGRIRAGDAVETLIKATIDADEGVRVAAIKSLEAIGDVQAVVPLIIVLAHEQIRQRSTGRSSLAVERAASRALDTLCVAGAIGPLQSALGHDEADVRDIAARRLSRVGSAEVAGSLAAALHDKDPGVRRSAARGLAEIGWQPPANLTGAQYWVALREWRRCAESGSAAIPLLLAAYDGVDAPERADIVAALVRLHWKPEAANATAAHYWAAQGHWDKCIEIGEPAVEALESILRAAPRWRDRVAAAATLATLNRPVSAPFARLDLVQRALAILDGEGTGDEKRGLLEALLTDEHQLHADANESVEWCACGYPASKVGNDELRVPLADLLGFEQSSSSVTTYYCPSCDTRRETVAT